MAGRETMAAKKLIEGSPRTPLLEKYAAKKTSTEAEEIRRRASPTPRTSATPKDKWKDEGSEDQDHYENLL